MSSESKVWTRFGEAVIVGAAVGAASLASAASLPQAVHRALAASVTMTLAAEGEGSSTPTPNEEKRQKMQAPASGEGAEGAGDTAASPITDDILYLNLLGQVQGHLTVGVALYEAGATKMALMHMKHPGDELYTTIKPALDARHAPDFAPALAALATSIEGNATLPEVKKALNGLEVAIAKSGAVVDTQSIAGTRLRLAAVHSLIHTAAEEYAQGVKDGQVVNGHEYQDAYGFTRVGKAMLDGLSSAQREAAAGPVEEIDSYIATLLAKAWPSVVPPEAIETDASLLYGAAARIELAYRAVK